MLIKSVSPLTVTTLALASSVMARDVPSNVQNFYSKVKQNSSCDHELQGGFYSQQGGPKCKTFVVLVASIKFTFLIGKEAFSYCQDPRTGVIFIHGKDGKLANMDIDCDGTQGGAGEDGRCGKSTDTQSQTTFKDIIASYHAGIDDLNAKVHAYVVFGNDDTSPSFDPRQYGIEPLSVMAVICGDKLVYGIWGDTNGNDGPPLVGEASISLATACYGKSNINGNQGHDDDDVLYVAFPGTKAVPGAKGAKWSVQSYDDFEKSIETLGDKLIAGL